MCDALQTVPSNCQTHFTIQCHMKAIINVVIWIFDETVTIDRFFTLEGHRAKLVSPMDSQTPLSYMFVIHLKAVIIKI